jgi:hypothetical protein
MVIVGVSVAVGVCVYCSGTGVFIVPSGQSEFIHTPLKVPAKIAFVSQLISPTFELVGGPPANWLQLAPSSVLTQTFAPRPKAYMREELQQFVFHSSLGPVIPATAAAIVTVWPVDAV